MMLYIFIRINLESKTHQVIKNLLFLHGPEFAGAPAALALAARSSGILPALLCQCWRRKSVISEKNDRFVKNSDSLGDSVVPRALPGAAAARSVTWMRSKGGPGGPCPNAGWTPVWVHGLAGLVNARGRLARTRGSRTEE